MTKVKKRRLSTIDKQYQKTYPDWENYLYEQITTTYNLPAPVKEFRFSPARRFRADFAYPELQILIEVEGGIFMRGRHVSGAGYTRDCQKYNLAATLGFSVLRFTPNMVKSEEAILTIVQMFYQKGAIDEGRYHYLVSTLQKDDRRKRVAAVRGKRAKDGK